jgi:hypothetical protein
MFGAYLANLLVWAFGTVNTLDIPIVFSEALSCVLCTHMLLNVLHPLDREVELPEFESNIGLHGLHDLHGEHPGPSFALRATSTPRNTARNVDMKMVPGTDTPDFKLSHLADAGSSTSGLGGAANDVEGKGSKFR